jgi:flagellar basal body P-ring formation protein FlgA
MISPYSIDRALHRYSGIFYRFTLTIALSVFLPLIANAAPLEPQLNEKVEVQGHLVTLAHLFQNAGMLGHTPVFRSPDPGTTGRISVRRIISAAKARGLKVSVLPAFTRVTITRSSRIIANSELEGLIRDRLENRLPSNLSKGQLVIKLPESFKKLHVDSKLQGELNLSKLDWSARSGRFTAHFALADSDPIIIKGMASMMIEVGVTTKNILRGETITSSNVALKYVRASGRQRQHFTTLEEMVGLSAKRRLTVGRPISASDLERPKLIQKNQLVTILLEVPGLVIRTEGKALEDATRGDTVKVLNTQSKRIIHATAIASGLVSVSLRKSIRSGS